MLAAFLAALLDSRKAPPSQVRALALNRPMAELRAWICLPHPAAYGFIFFRCCLPHLSLAVVVLLPRAEGSVERRRVV